MTALQRSRGRWRRRGHRHSPKSAAVYASTGVLEREQSTMTEAAQKPAAAADLRPFHQRARLSGIKVAPNTPAEIGLPKPATARSAPRRPHRDLPVSWAPLRRTA